MRSPKGRRGVPARVLRVRGAQRPAEARAVRSVRRGWQAGAAAEAGEKEAAEGAGEFQAVAGLLDDGVLDSDGARAEREGGREGLVGGLRGEQERAEGNDRVRGAAWARAEAVAKVQGPVLRAVVVDGESRAGAGKEGVGEDAGTVGQGGG